MSYRFPAVVWAYITLAGCFLGANLLSIPYDGPRVPKVSFLKDTNKTFGGLSPSGMVEINHAALKSSVNRLSAVRMIREIGNSLRLLGGQRISWVIWGRKEPLTLFGDIEIPVSRGLNTENRRHLTTVADIIANYAKRLAAEDWTLVVVPVPTKLGIHRELADWPIYDSDLVSLKPVEKDRSDEYYGFLHTRLEERKVPHVDLHTVYRKALSDEPNLLFFAPNDSHWSGEGIRRAAKATADVIAQVSSLTSRIPLRPTFHKVSYVGDLVKAHDLWPGLTTWLNSAWEFDDLLLNGEESIGYTYATNPIGLVAAVGTSYTGQYTWVAGQPVGYAWQLSLHLDNVEVQNRPHAGLGSFHSFKLFWMKRNEIASEFDAKYGFGKNKVVVWEFPIRDVMVILGHPTLP